VFFVEIAGGSYIKNKKKSCMDSIGTWFPQFVSLPFLLIGTYVYLPMHG
jgi:hypothetical protein